MSETKICGSCKQFLPANNEFFAVFKRSKDGLSTMCKICKSDYDKKYREKNKDKIRACKKRSDPRKEYHKQWREANKEYLKKYREENKDKITEFNKKYWSENKEKQKQKVSIWRIENKEHIRQYRKNNQERDKEKRRKWYKSEQGNKLSRTKTNAYRAKKRVLKNTLTAKEWETCIEYFDKECSYCGCKPELIEQEHFIPVNKKGAFVKENIVTACRSCNASKADKDFFEWYREQSFYSNERELKILSYLGKVTDERTF